MDSEMTRVAVRAPPFWETNSELWFIQLESQFQLTGISVDETKFHTVVASLDSKVLSCVADIVRNPPSDAMYDALKTRILSHFSQRVQNCGCYFKTCSWAMVNHLACCRR
ncbi:hypothetical protein AVEN_13320-1 [Araneus ventricosus]|uniref:DUF7041 domain-containing protein n=1 Tax=Araneus ventricosus TaxID=182803 RepID=A0A4Y2S0Q7_ARAVE|nr:hypothetical protein AVEN_13320-1 [Araneus ventricosus]